MTHDDLFYLLGRIVYIGDPDTLEDFDNLIAEEQSDAD